MIRLWSFEKCQISSIFPCLKSIDYDVFREMMGDSGSNSNDVEEKSNEGDDDDDEDEDDEDYGNEKEEEETDNSEE